MSRRYAKRDPRGLDLALRADEPLRHRLLGDEERAGDLAGSESTESSQRERDLGVELQRGMATGEDELQPLVGNRRLVQFVLPSLRRVEQAELFLQRAIPAVTVDRTVAGGRHQPGTRVGRRPLAGPALGGDRERLLGGLLGKVEVAEEADQGRENAAPFLAEDLRKDF
jgi:hypothetical protein